MSKLDDLIQKLCPNGVEYKSILELFNTRNGYTPSKSQNKYWENGTIPWFRMEDIRENGRILSEAMQYVSESAVKGIPFPANSIIVATSATIGEHALIKVPSLANQRFTYLMLKEEYSDCMDIMFVYYYCFRLDEYCKICLNQGNFASVDMKKFVKFKFPVPPLEVQYEIVRILDSFTLLTAELIAELTARKKQYDFYRNQLLKFNFNTQNVQLQDIAKFTYGYTDKAQDKGDTRFIRITDIDDNGCLNPTGAKYINLSEDSQKYLLHKGDLLLARTGATYGKTLYYPTDEPAVYASFLIKISLDNSKILNRYYWHFSKSQLYWNQAEKLVSKGGQQQFNTNAAGRVIVPVPTLEIQKKIVDVLDNFNAICTDLNIGLPAEIEARQKQYEYYRDMLLTFSEADKIIGGGYNENLIKLIQYVFGYVTLPLGKLFDFRNGLSKGKDFFGRGIPFIRYTDVYNKRYLKENDIIALVECTPDEIEKLGVHRGDVFFTRTSETAEDIGWSSVMLDNIGDCVFNGFTIKATPKTSYLLPEYCAFCFATDEFRQYVTSHCAFTTRASLTGKTIAEYQLSFPSIKRQQEIVNVLSKFHTLCNDLSAGLPAEMEARQKQYEYYRDKLLSFKELSR